MEAHGETVSTRAGTSLFGEQLRALLGAPPAPLRPEERKVLSILAATAFCGSMQLVFAFTIPFIAIGALGLIVLSGSIALAREVFIFRRTKNLLYGVFQPFALLILTYMDYVMLAEALDKDEVTLASSDNLERSLQKNLGDRISAYFGIAADVGVALLSFALADATLSLRRAYTGAVRDDAPWVVQILGGTHPSAGNEETRATGRIDSQLWYGEYGDIYGRPPSSAPSGQHQPGGGRRHSASYLTAACGSVLGGGESPAESASPSPMFSGASFRRGPRLVRPSRAQVANSPNLPPGAVLGSSCRTLQGFLNSFCASRGSCSDTTCSETHEPTTNRPSACPSDIAAPASVPLL